MLKHRGQAFEDFFTRAGIALWRGDFMPYRPQGPLGDFKCDGYLSTERTVFQCFAPERPTPTDFVSKINTDFEGARSHFGARMRKWVFVHNSRNGLPALAADQISQLNAGHPALTIESWTPDHLIDQLMGLPEYALRNLFSTYPEGQTLSEATVEFMEEYVRSHRVSSETEEKQEAPSNRDALDEMLENFGDEDHDIRRRLLGYSKWFDPAKREEISLRLEGFGYGRPVVEQNASRLEEAGLIRITEHYYLPLDDDLCQLAANTLFEEILAEL